MNTGRRTRGRGFLFLALVGTLLSVPSCAGKHRSKEPPLPPEQAYQMAIAKMEKKRYYTARTMLQALLPRIAPDDRDLLPKVQLAIADAYFKDGGLLNYGEALNAYRNFIIYYPQHPSSDRAQFMVAMSLFKQVPAPDRDQALTLKAIEEFNKVAATYPDSTFAQKAREQVILCQDELAEHERLVGWFYQRRKAYGAALDRYVASIASCTTWAGARSRSVTGSRPRRFWASCSTTARTTRWSGRPRPCSTNFTRRRRNRTGRPASSEGERIGGGRRAGRGGPPDADGPGPDLQRRDQHRRLPRVGALRR
ncbi:MAG: hypothetical protein DMF50_03680 [Acidobacteria bacterium]|nr:MAG: hypothetical protein DMF50_03680 [Acidobacteriota bacterium]